MKETLKAKLLICVAALCITAVVTLMFFLDTSMAWNAYKISSCVMIDIWVYALIPSFRLEYLSVKRTNTADGYAHSFKTGVDIAFGTALCILIAPFYAVKYFVCA